MSHEKSDLIYLIRTADRFLVESTPEAKQELVDLVSALCQDYNQLRAVKRGPHVPLEPVPEPRISFDKLRSAVSFMRQNHIPPLVFEGVGYYEMNILISQTGDELALYAAAAQMLKALQHVTKYLDEVTENYEARRKPYGLICAKEFVNEAIIAACGNPATPLN